MTKVIDIRTGTPVTNLADREAQAAGLSMRVATHLAVGCTFDSGNLRTHRYRDNLVLWDLTNAGKRGKKVTKLNVSPSYTLNSVQRDAILEQTAAVLEKLQSYQLAASLLAELAATYKTIDLSATELRGVDVAPTSVKPIHIKTEILDLTATYSDFSISCLKDQHNQPTAIPAISNGKKSIPLFYAWVSANQDRIKTMSYQEVLTAMREQGIRYHDYCAMD